MKTICIMNLKGGVGKTVTADNMAAILAVDRGKRVLLIDADQRFCTAPSRGRAELNRAWPLDGAIARSQGNTSRFFLREEEISSTVRDILTGDSEPYWPENVYHTGYDRLDVIPADMSLAERHDHAAAALQTAEDEAAMKRYRARFQRLTEQFSFSADGLCVVVPKGVQDIVREGRVLMHCVGGYAGRHVEGMVTILFLRKESAPGVPYVTIEMSTENNCQELRIRQIHGYRNEMDGRQSPASVHAGFLKTWLDWVHAGSPRNPEGRPIVAKVKEISVA